MELRWLQKKDGTTRLQALTPREIDPKPACEPIIVYDWVDVPIVEEK